MKGLPRLHRRHEMGRIVDHEIKRGYQEHYILSVLSSGIKRKPKVDDLACKGYGVYPVLDCDYAASWALRLEEAGGSIKVQDVDLRDIKELFGRVFGGPLYDVIINHYFTEFAPLFLSFTTVKPLQSPRGLRSSKTSVLSQSAFWHCDHAPTRHLKILIYLNQKSEHDSATEVIPRAQTELFKRIGYGYIQLNKRVFDLRPLAQRHKIDISVERLCPDIGEAVVFEPSCVLHKGVYPTRGVRHVLQIGVVPWGVHWRKFFSALHPFVINNNTAHFPNLSPDKSARNQWRETIK